MPPISVSFGCDPLNIAMGGCSPPLPIVTPKNGDFPDIAMGNRSDIDSNCDPNTIATLGRKNITDIDNYTGTKCKTDGNISLDNVDSNDKEGDIVKIDFDQKQDDKDNEVKDNEAGKDVVGKVKSKSEGSGRIKPFKVAHKSPLHVKNATNVSLDYKVKSSSNKSPRSNLKLRSCKLGQNSPRKGFKTKIGCNKGDKMDKSAKTDTEKGSKADKNNMKLSVKKIKTLKEYFESLSEKPPDVEVQKDPVKVESAKDDEVDDSIALNNAQEESVRFRINVFERMMRPHGDTHQKTPKKRIRRIGNGSSRKKL